MKIEYVDGQRLTKLVHELSPLEAAIERYTEKARAYFLQGQNPDKSQTQVERDKKLSIALKHLEHERRLAEVIVTVQAQLEAYRAFGREQKGSVGRATLGAEAHHPAEILGKYLQADGRPKPSAQHVAHHIVPGKGKTKVAALARLHMHRFGVRINDPDNGVWLVRKKADTPHWSMPASKSHGTIHTHNYETWVYSAIRITRNEADTRRKLGLLGRMLEYGTQPKQVTMPPDSSWTGQ